MQMEMKKRESFEKSQKLTQETTTAGDAEKVKKTRWQQCTIDSFVISSTNKWKKAFDVLIVILAVYSTYSSTYLYRSFIFI